MRVRVVVTDVFEDRRGENVYYRQPVEVHFGPGNIGTVEVSVPKDKPYPVGEYEFSPRSWKVNRFGSGVETDPYRTVLESVQSSIVNPKPKVAA